MSEILSSDFNIDDGRKCASFFGVLCFIILRKVKHNWNAKKSLSSVWRQCSDWPNVSKVVYEVSCWRFLTGWCSISGRPVEVDSNQMETLIEKNQHYTMQEKAGIFTISKSIKFLMKMKNLSFILQKKLNGLFGQPNSLTLVLDWNALLGHPAY